MKIIGEIILLALGAFLLLLGDRQFGAYGPVSKWLFNPPTSQTGKKMQEFGKKLVKWILGGVLIYFGLILILARQKVVCSNDSYWC